MAAHKDSTVHRTKIVQLPACGTTSRDLCSADDGCLVEMHQEQRNLGTLTAAKAFAQRCAHPASSVMSREFGSFLDASWKLPASKGASKASSAEPDRPAVGDVSTSTLTPCKSKDLCDAPRFSSTLHHDATLDPFAEWGTHMTPEL